MIMFSQVTVTAANWKHDGTARVTTFTILCYLLMQDEIDSLLSWSTVVLHM